MCTEHNVKNKKITMVHRLYHTYYKGHCCDIRQSRKQNQMHQDVPIRVIHIKRVFYGKHARKPINREVIKVILSLFSISSCHFLDKRLRCMLAYQRGGFYHHNALHIFRGRTLFSSCIADSFTFLHKPCHTFLQSMWHLENLEDLVKQAK